MSGQSFGVRFPDVEDQGQQLELRVGENHDVVPELYLMQSRSLGTFTSKSVH